MENLRRYGQEPFNVAVIHGGPGAPGYMAPVARELSHDWGVLEPLQTESSLEGEILELQAVLEENGGFPVTLIGSSWGAMLGYIFTAQHPELVQKLILIGSAVYEEKYETGIQKTRLSRLNEEEKQEARNLMKSLQDPTVGGKNAILARLGALTTKADTYDPLTLDTEIIECKYHIYHNVWIDAVDLRNSGKLLELGMQINCPVVAIHGDYDPHPAAGVQKPLSAILNDFRFILLKNCGHLPWIEREARDEFLRILKEELP